jgi:hypothetical protein
MEATGWLRHISTIVGGAVDVVKRIIAGDSVLIHCSDGWDRTSIDTHRYGVLTTN